LGKIFNPNKYKSDRLKNTSKERPAVTEAEEYIMENGNVEDG
jgi:hypothetical protein